MVKFELIEVSGIEGALRGMRNPMDSWELSDSGWCNDGLYESCRKPACENVARYCVGDKDMALAKKLIKAGPEHRKFLRMINVIFDVELPMYVLKELDTYRVGVTCNSCSTMHKLGSRPLTIDDFAIDSEVLMARGVEMDFGQFLSQYNQLMALWKHTIKEDDKKDYWRLMIQWLPMSYIQRRTYSMNYEVVLNILNQRKTHKLKEWRWLCEELIKLPYVFDFYMAMEGFHGNH